MPRILCVDDDLPLLGLTKAFLEIDGDMSVRTCGSAREAMALLGSGSFDAVVSDFQMPDMDGIELLKAVRGRHPTLPFILFTGKGREEVAVDALRNGADSYIMKGGDASSQFRVLSNEVRLAVARREAEEAIQFNLERFNLIMRYLTEIVFLVTETGLVTYVSPSVTSMLGYDRAEVEGRTLSDLRFFNASPERDMIDSWLPLLLRSAENEGMIVPIRAKNGDVRRVSITSKLVEQAGKRFIVASAKDVTQHFSMQEDVKVKERLLSATLDEMPIPAGILDCRLRRMILANAAASALFGLLSEEMIGKSPEELGLIGDKMRKEFLDSMPSNLMIHGIDIAVSGRGGIKRPLSLSLMKIPVDNEQFIFFLLRERG